MKLFKVFVHDDPNLQPWLKAIIRYRYVFFTLAAFGIWIDKNLIPDTGMVALYSIIMIYLGLVFKPYWQLLFQSLLVTSSRFYCSSQGIDGFNNILNFVMQWFCYFVIGYVVSCLVKKNVEQLKNKEEIHQLAYYDFLTGLPNRNTLYKTLNKYLDEFNESNKKFALIFIDIDRFKWVNDTLGHDIGDELLVEFAQRIKGTLETAEMFARQGGDEFYLVRKFEDESEIIHLASRIIQQFSNPFFLKNETVYVSASLGISLYPQNGKTINLLQKNADKAMYVSKQRGPNGYHFYENESEDLMLRKVRLEARLRLALETSSLDVHYQPQVDLNSVEIVGFEALLRWTDSELGPISPEEFIPLAEETGLIVPIGKWVLLEACKHQKELNDRSGTCLPISINVSVMQFKEAGFIVSVKQILAETHFDPELLHIEITESVMQRHEETSKIIEELKSQGIKISIDDFGTGFSSLSVLKHFNIDYIKIDQSFVKDMLENAHAASIVKTILIMSEKLGFKVIAEGIENHHQAEFLRNEKCAIGQGYLFSKPLPKQKVVALLSNALVEIV